MRDEIKELFPTADGDIFYISYQSKSPCNSATGSLINYYKYVKSQLRLAGLLVTDTKKKTEDKLPEHENPIGNSEKKLFFK